MPIKAIYWADPEKHKAYARARNKYLIIKGLKGHEQPALYAKNLKLHNEWNKAHRDHLNEANKRYWKKLAKEAGGYSRPKVAEEVRKRREAKLRRIYEDRQML